MNALGECPQLIPERADNLDLYDTAKWVSGLDLVISVDTSIAHLAGALNVPTWILLSTACDWRWMANRADSPWYPSARLFRQTRYGDWGELIQRVRRGLEDLVEARKKKF